MVSERERERKKEREKRVRVREVRIKWVYYALLGPGYILPGCSASGQDIWGQVFLHC